MSKPHAVPENLVCSECDLPWADHPKNPRRRDCIELLKDAKTVQYIPYWNQWSYTVKDFNKYPYSPYDTYTFNTSGNTTNTVSIPQTVSVPDDPEEHFRPMA